jgi:hypothetical protein
MGREFPLVVNHLLFGKFLISFYKNHDEPVKGKDSPEAGPGGFFPPEGLL